MTDNKYNKAATNKMLKIFNDKSMDAETKAKAVSFCIECGADVNARDENGMTALMKASLENNHEMVEILLDKGADVTLVNNEGKTVADMVAEEGYNELAVKLFVKEKQQLEKINEAEKEELSKKMIYTELVKAIEEGNKEEVEKLLKKGANIEAKDEYGKSALMLASSEGHKEIVELLLEKNANVNARDEHGSSALSKASVNGYKEIVELLIEKGADIKVKSVAGITPLGIAIKNNDCEMVRVLIRNGSGFKFFNVKEKEFFLTADDSVRRVVFEEIKKQNKVLKFFMKNDLVASR